MGSLLMNHLHMVWQSWHALNTSYCMGSYISIRHNGYSYIQLGNYYVGALNWEMRCPFTIHTWATSDDVSYYRSSSGRFRSLYKAWARGDVSPHIPFHSHCTVDLNHNSYSHERRSCDVALTHHSLLADARWIETHCYVDSRNRPNPILTYFSHMNIQYVSLLLFNCSFRLPRRRL